MTAWIEPEVVDGGLRWRLGAAEVHALEAAGGWVVARSWQPGTVRVAARPRLGLRLGAGDALAFLRVPVVVEPGAELSWWWQWPLELLLAGEGDRGVVMEAPGRRQAMLGGADSGRLVSAAWVSPLSGLDADRPLGTAALAVRVRHRGDQPVVLRRVLVPEAELGLVQLGNLVVAGTVGVRLVDAATGEVRALEVTAVGGYGMVGADLGGRASGLTLDWLRDAGRRGVEFAL